jgi:hypothetical protein
MADIRPDRLTTCQSDRKSVVSRRPSVSTFSPNKLTQQMRPAINISTPKN